MIKNNCPVFILTHGRPDNQSTLNTLKRAGFTGKVYLVLDDLDSTIDEYRKNYEEEIIVFDKKSYMTRVDRMSSELKLSSSLYARNAIVDAAKERGYEYFAMADDDITGLVFRYQDGNSLKSKGITNLDEVIDAMIEFLKLEQISTVSFSGQKCYIGGVEGKFKRGLIPSFYQFAICKTSADLSFMGLHNDDFNLVLSDLPKGKLNYSLAPLSVSSPVRGSNAGGIDVGDDFKFVQYSMMLCPSGVSFTSYANKLVLKVINDKTYPKILSSSYKKSV